MLQMSGNVGEWEDACGPDMNGELNCTLRGGSFKNITSQCSCTAVVIAKPAAAFEDIGFRCCADP